MRDRKLFHRRCLYVDTSGQNAPDIPYTNELSAYLSDYYWKLSFVGYIQDIISYRLLIEVQST